MVKEVFQRYILNDLISLVTIMTVVDNVATEKKLVNYTGIELFELMDKPYKAFYKMGNSWYIII